ncbi:MAG: branched-chain amino acid ABC transporter permease [Solirubrobacterales bacterium]|nr:branched-chain amino acid ABC transporter permease [Solirubrobacterales bacterium]
MTGRLVGGLALLAALALVPQLASPFWVFVLATAVAYMVAALSVNVLLGQAGMVGLFPAAFVGLGAYFAAIVAGETGSWVLAVLAAAAVCLAVGAVVGVTGTRLRGMAFGIVTLAFALAMEAVAFRHGFLGIDPAFGATLDRPVLLGVDFIDDVSVYYLVLAVAVVTWAVVALHERARPGRTWRAIRDDEVAAMTLGARVGLYRIWAAALSGAVGGVAGALFITVQGQANVESFTTFASLLIFAAAMTAGTRSVAGAVLAGLLLAALPELLIELAITGKVVPLLFAFGVLTSLKGHDGIVGGVRHAASALRARAGRRGGRGIGGPPRPAVEGGGADG